MQPRSPRRRPNKHTSSSLLVWIIIQRTRNKDTRSDVEGNGHHEKKKTNLRERRDVKLRLRNRKLIRDDARHRVTGREERCGDLRMTANHRSNGHGFTNSATESEKDRAKDSALCIWK